MSWRVVAAVMIAIFSIVIVSAATAEPLRQTTDALEDLDGADSDVSEQADSGIRAYGNLILILSFGIIGWGAWRVLRREITEGRL